jgi:hypothetical protein
MELFAYTSEGVSFEGSFSKKEKETTDEECMTDGIKYVNRGMNTRPLKDQETQVEIKKKRTKENGDVESFIKKVEDLMHKELDKTSKAFQCI